LGYRLILLLIIGYPIVKKSFREKIIVHHFMNTIITLTTDFGYVNEYVGVMKGVILAGAPDACIVDLTHGIPAQAVQEAAYILDASYEYFPAGTIHVVVVDPGVGSARRIVLLRAGGHLFLAPDNGVLTLLLAKERFESAYEVNRDDLFLKPVSNTFHGRDILAPVAAHLASGLPANEVGPQLSIEELTRLSLPAVTIDLERGSVEGVVVRVDGFGNLITNILQHALPGTDAGQQEAKISVTVKGRTIRGIQAAYDSVQPGTLLAIFGSRNYLEIAANRVNAAKILNAGPGDMVKISIGTISHEAQKRKGREQ